MFHNTFCNITSFSQYLLWSHVTKCIETFVTSQKVREAFVTSQKVLWSICDVTKGENLVVSTQTLNYYISIIHNLTIKPNKMDEIWIAKNEKKLSSRTPLPWKRLTPQSNIGVKILISNKF